MRQFVLGGSVQKSIQSATARLMKFALLGALLAVCSQIGLAQTAHFGSFEKTIVSSGLKTPNGVAVDANGNLYIADTWHNRALKGTPTGTGYTETVIGNGLQGPGGISVDGAGNAYAADFGVNDVLKLDMSDAPTMNFTCTKLGATSSDSPRIITVTNIGNAPLTFPVPTAGSNPNASSSFTLNASASACPVLYPGAATAASLATNGSCLLSISFTPVASGTLAGTLTVKDNSLNAAAPNYVTQRLPLSGTATN